MFLQVARPPEFSLDGMGVNPPLTFFLHRYSPYSKGVLEDTTVLILDIFLITDSAIREQKEGDLSCD
jgi:hypothetical protein